jgi:cytochrome c biogenesis protein CcmG/thiol:disulfide interchange protein DsbE
MPKISPLMIAPPLVFVGFAALAFFGMYRDDPNGMPSTLVGQMAPGVPELPLADFPQATAEMLATGEVTLVNFWASWCPPCRAEHPKLLEMEAAGVNIIGINFKDTERAATTYLINDDNPFAGVGFDPQRHLSSTAAALCSSALQARWWGVITNSGFYLRMRRPSDHPKHNDHYN